MKNVMVMVAAVAVLAAGASAAYVFDDFESYADSAELGDVWVVNTGANAMAQTLETENGSQVMKMVYDTGGAGWAQTRRALDGAVWQSHGVNLTYQGFTGISMDVKVTDMGGRVFFTMINCWGSTVLRAYLSEGTPTPLTDGWVNWTFDFADTIESGHNLENVYQFTLGATGAWYSHPTGDIWVDNITLIPEPASLALLGLGSVALLRRRK